MATLLDVRGLEKTFRLHILHGKMIPALSGISFTMEEGEILGLAGRSGSGKSTLMKCLYRTYLPTAGSILFHSRQTGTAIDPAQADEHAVIRLRRFEMTYCAQFLQVIPRVPALDIVAEPMIRRGAVREEALGRAQEAFERMSLPRELWDAYPATFSGGEQQRVNIARAIMARPRFLLLDEPTASLDRNTKDAVIDMILELKQEGTSMMLITHDAHTMSRLACRTLHLSEGRIAEPAYA